MIKIIPPAIENVNFTEVASAKNPKSKVPITPLIEPAKENIDKNVALFRAIFLLIIG